MDPMMVRRKEDNSSSEGRATLNNAPGAESTAPDRTGDTFGHSKPTNKFGKSGAAKVKALIKKPGKKIIAIVVAAIVVIAAAVLLVTYFTAPLHITKVETLLAMSSRTENPPAQDKFTATDPIMLYFEYSGASVGTAVKFEVKNSDGEVVKSGSTTVLRESGDDKADGKRYASIVNMPSTALPVGQYKVTLTIDSREVGSAKFEVEN